MFHTQGKEKLRLIKPIKCEKEDAWLGDGWYFWYHEHDAHFWGIKFKSKTKYYEIYTADIDCENVLDTVFNEAHYLLWIKYVEKAISSYLKKLTNKKITIKDINEFFKDKKVFENVDGVMFQDISNNPENWVVDKFQYRKRIQLAVYNSSIISNFSFNFEGQCV